MLKTDKSKLMLGGSLKIIGDIVTAAGKKIEVTCYKYQGIWLDECILFADTHPVSFLKLGEGGSHLHP